MSFVLQPWQLLLLILAGWGNREQQRIIEYQRTEIEVLKELFGKKRILLNDNQRRRLASKRVKRSDANCDESSDTYSHTVRFCVGIDCSWRGSGVFPRSKLADLKSAKR